MFTKIRATIPACLEELPGPGYDHAVSDLPRRSRHEVSLRRSIRRRAAQRRRSRHLPVFCRGATPYIHATGHDAALLPAHGREMRPAILIVNQPALGEALWKP